MHMSKQDWSIELIGGRLKITGRTYRDLDRSAGKAPDTVRNALYRHIPSYEKIIANALGVTPEEIWPSRYQKKTNKTNMPQ